MFSVILEKALKKNLLLKRQLFNFKVLNIISSRENKTIENVISFTFLRIKKCRFLPKLCKFKIKYKNALFNPQNSLFNCLRILVHF